MNKIALVSGGLAATLFSFLSAAPSGAEILFVSGNGLDTNSAFFCGDAKPCATFQKAHDTAHAGAQISCLDPGDFGRIVITKSITIDCTGTFGKIIVTNPAIGNAVTLNGANIVVTLRGLELDGGAAGIGDFGVSFFNGSALRIENSRISGFRGGSFSRGISITPQDGITQRVYVSDSVISNNGHPNFGGGIVIQPTGSGTARVVLNRVKLENNTYGVFANGTGSTGTISVDVRDSEVSGSAFNGISAFTAAGQSTTSITVDHSSSLLNAGAGILAQGPPAFVTLGAATVISNKTGLSAADGSHILTYQNNQLTGNSIEATCAPSPCTLPPNPVLTVQ